VDWYGLHSHLKKEHSHRADEKVGEKCKESSERSKSAYKHKRQMMMS
jgi:hypothetical protein